MMKKVILITILIIYSYANAQNSFSYNFLGEDFQLYKGIQLRLAEETFSGFNYSFYSDLKYCQTNDNSNVIYPNKNNVSTTVKDSLKNRVFNVENIIDKSGKDWNESSIKENFDKPIFLLKDIANGQIIYYRFDKENETKFPFITSKINYPIDYFCSQIQEQKDEINNEIKLSSPLIRGNKILPLTISRYVNNGKSIFYLSLNAKGNTVNVNQKGVTVLFQDGTKWTKACKIDVQAGYSGYDYSAFITLTKNDLITFSTKEIKKFRLYIYDTEINPSDASKFRMYTECIMKAK
jgi:hypothetical protein